MARIKIEELPKDLKISKEEMKNVLGAMGFSSTSPIFRSPSLYYPFKKLNQAWPYV